ncbi:MAG: histidine kinase [Ruminococcus sp.]|nr:histidine kinase [Ruminococcus sp.]
MAVKKQKNQKLLIQTALVFLSVMIVLIVSVSAAVYTSTINGFLKSQESTMELSLNEMQGFFKDDAYLDAEGVSRWYIDKWEKFAPQISALDFGDYRSFATKEEAEMVDKYKAAHPDIEPSSPEFFEQMPEELEYFYAKTYYKMICYTFEKIYRKTNYHSLLMIDISKGNEGIVIAAQGGDKKLGDRFDIDLSQHPAIKKITETNSSDVIFEKSNDFPEKGHYYIGYRPFFTDGKLRALLCVTYDWKQIRLTTARSIRLTLIISISIVAAALFVLLAALYRWSVRPVKKIEQALIDYIGDKSSKKIIKKMYGIKVRNELGFLADVISDLVLEVDLYNKEALRTQKELYDAQVQIMVSQIQPHFMYNALASIAILCKLDPATAYEATVTFSKYLRGNMDSLKQTEPVSFERELEHLKQYLYIEKLRFADKLNIQYDIHATDFKVPMLSIQPIVENAVKHGVGMKREGGTVTIAANETENGYEIVVSDDGVGFDADAPKKDDGRSHVGMENTRKRLRDMCNAEITVTSTPGEGTTVRIIIPKVSKEDEDP